MEISHLQILVGYLCTSIFMLSRVPMLLKAVRTRDLSSYSLGHLAMSAGANLLFWIYVVGLAFGPVWILQIFFTVTDLTMLTLCVKQRRLEKKGSAKLGQLVSSSPGNRHGHSLSLPQASQLKAME